MKIEIVKRVNVLDFTIESIGDIPFPPNLLEMKKGSVVQMKYGEYEVHF